MKRPALITFLSDFGLDDSYVAEVKAVLLRCVPAPTVVDLTHLVPPFQIEAGAFQLLRAYSHFPEGTVHLAVVDPGVGTERACSYVRSARYHFVGPDNGLLRWAVRDAEAREGRRAEYFGIPVLDTASSTFHARDVFAPFIAALVGGESVDTGVVMSAIAGRDFPVVRREGGGVTGEIVAIDRYGNAVTSVPVASFATVAVTTARVHEREIPDAPSYGAIAPGAVALVRGSHGYWELAAREWSASALLKLRLGDAVRIFSGHLV